ncbi:LacI family DNA-binding transcriptional regulator [Streptomyces sp. NPDC057694]|uniref:LacI family DNA-binding transcriptional regulator n=1 Tax=Streptomyces sp. NPDC057694 TaxID=3346216 RepID=UPI0036C85F69
MADVAQDAGVSLGTVSNVFYQPERVAPDTRRRVQSATERLSVRPYGQIIRVGPSTP